MFHDLATAQAAVTAHGDGGRPLWLLTPPGAAGQGGPAYYWEILRRVRAAHPEIAVEAVLDCGDDAAAAHFALVMGWKRIVLGGGASLRSRIAAIAENFGAHIHAKAPKVT